MNIDKTVEGHIDALLDQYQILLAKHGVKDIGLSLLLDRVAKLGAAQAIDTYKSPD